MIRPGRDTVTNRCTKPRTVERCEAYLDKLAELIAQAGEDWVVYQPLVERLEQEIRQAGEALAMRERMLKRRGGQSTANVVSPLPRTVRLVEPDHPDALSLDQIWQLAAPANSNLDADDKRILMLVCRNSRIVKACRDEGKSLAFVR